MLGLQVPVTKIFLVITYYILLISIPVQGQNNLLGFRILGNKKKVTIPFENHNNLIVIPVIVNDAIPLKFVVDTGVRTAILTDPIFSDILNIPFTRKISIMGADGLTTIDAFVANNISFRMPGIRGQGQALLVLKEDYLLLSKTLGADVHGIMGYELFSRFVITINYDKNILTLHEPSEFRPPRSSKKIPIEIIDTKPYIKTFITLEDGVTIDAKLMMDTGASHSLLLNLSSDERLNLPQNVVAANLGRGLGGDIDGYLGRINGLTLGMYKFKDIIVSFPEGSTYNTYLERTGRLGTLGGGIIGRFNITFDYFNEMIYLRKNRQFYEKFEYNMSGLDVIAEGPSFSKFVINGVAKNSNAEKAGILPGDIIKMINYSTTYGLTINEINNILRSKNNKKVRVVLERNGEKIKKKYKLERIL